MSSGITKTRRLGRFEIIEQLGSGAFGAVYRAVDTVLRREVALKVPLAASLRSDEARARFLREPKAAAQLRHPNIVPVFDAGNDGDLYYIAYAYIEGQTLERALATEAIDFRRAAQLVRTLAEALGYAHTQQVIHRDVKPANVMLDIHGEPHLLDFGLARIESLGETVTQDGSLLGTPAFMSPEQAEGAEVGPGADQYALGVILYQLLTGYLPFSGNTVQVLYQVRTQDPPPLTRHRPNIPRDLETICLKAIAKKPEERYSSCGALAADLRRWLDDESIAARRASPWERAVRWSRKNQAWAALAAVVLFFAIVSSIAAVGFFTVYRRAESNYERAETVLNDLRSETETRRETERALRQREKEVSEKEEELKRRDALLGEKDSAVVARDVALQKRDAELAQLAAELAGSKLAIEQSARDLAANKAELLKTVSALSKAVEARDAALDQVPWSQYVIGLARAQQLLLGGKKQEALDALDGCSDKYRSSEWHFLRAAAQGKTYRWQLKNPPDLRRYDRLLLSPKADLLFIRSGDHSAIVRTQDGEVQRAFKDIGRELVFSAEGEGAILVDSFVDRGRASLFIFSAGIEKSLDLGRFSKGLTIRSAHFSGDGSRLFIFGDADIGYPTGNITGTRGSVCFNFDIPTGLSTTMTLGEDKPNTGYGFWHVHIPQESRSCDWLIDESGNAYQYKAEIDPSKSTWVRLQSMGAISDYIGTAPGDLNYRRYSGGLRRSRIAVHPSKNLLVTGSGDIIELDPDVKNTGDVAASIRPLAFNTSGDRLAVIDEQSGELVYFETTSGGGWRKVFALDKRLFPVELFFEIGGDLNRAVTILENGTVVGWGWE